MIMASKKMSHCDYRTLRDRDTRAQADEIKAEKAKRRTKKLLFMLGMLIVFTACMGLIYFKAIISSTQMKINHMSSEMREIEQENSRLEGQLIKAGNIERIKMEASVLGMAAPTSDQVCYIALSTNEEDQDGPSLKVAPTSVVN